MKIKIDLNSGEFIVLETSCLPLVVAIHRRRETGNFYFFFKLNNRSRRFIIENC